MKVSFILFSLFAFLASVTGVVGTRRVQADTPTGVTKNSRKLLTESELLSWWMDDISNEDRFKLMNIFDMDWFESLSDLNRAAYAKITQALYEFVESSDEDSHPHDSYQGFGPLLLRASFHGAGTLHVPSGTGGTNGGTIFQNGELQDVGNSCIDIATKRLEALLTEHDLMGDGSTIVSKADTLVIAGNVALDSMDFPRMDLLRIIGGRKDVSVGIAMRNRLPSPDDNPSGLFTNSYDLTPSELTALIGGAHNFGAAHGVCTGYVGQWTSNPLSWNRLSELDDEADTVVDDDNTSEFFTDLLLDDWRWFEVCTYKNGTSNFVSIENPFANGLTGDEDAHEEKDTHTVEEESACALENNQHTFICEQQAMRGCDFDDGTYGPNELPCDSSLLHIRLKSDFILKIDPTLKPHSEAFAESDDYLAEEFAIAYHKLTHAGLNRCGLVGNLDGCTSEYATCVDTYDDATGEYLGSECLIEEPELLENAACWELGTTGSFILMFAFLMTSIIAVMLGIAIVCNATRKDRAARSGDDEEGSLDVIGVSNKPVEQSSSTVRKKTASNNGNHKSFDMSGRTLLDASAVTNTSAGASDSPHHSIDSTTLNGDI